MSDTPNDKEEKRIIEAALFISARPMALAELRTLTGIGAMGYLQKVVEELKRDYEGRRSAIEILGADGKYEMRIRADYVGRVKQFAQDTEISKAALRTLAFISKHDGVLKSELAKRIGSSVYQDVKELVEAGFVKPKKAGRSSSLHLTDKFHKYFVEGAVAVPAQPAKAEGEAQTTLPANAPEPEPDEERGEAEMQD
jgi:segregation and condensation protein B